MSRRTHFAALAPLLALGALAPPMPASRRYRVAGTDDTDRSLSLLVDLDDTTHRLARGGCAISDADRAAKHRAEVKRQHRRAKRWAVLHGRCWCHSSIEYIPGHHRKGCPWRDQDYPPGCPF